VKTYRLCLLALIASSTFMGMALVGTTREARVIEWWHPWLLLLVDVIFANLAWMACKEHHGLLDRKTPKDGGK